MQALFINSSASTCEPKIDLGRIAILLFGLECRVLLPASGHS